MSKALLVDPHELRRPGTLTFTAIPINQYAKTVAEEKTQYSRDDFLRIYRDMLVIREFENTLYEIKVKGERFGIKYDYPGPAHLCTGQEAVAVGQAYCLDQEDYIFGSHRSHGEIVAKGLSAIEKIAEDRLYQIMMDYAGGKILRVVEDRRGGPVDPRALAMDFLLYGTMAEIFAKDTGFQRGLGGSMHAFFTPFGIYPNNAIVGGAAGLALGAALFKKVNRQRGIVVANVGDGALGCGPVWEAMNMAAMDQYKLLWEEDYRGGLPLLFSFQNNQYGMGGQTSGETMGFGILARVGAGINPEQMHAERVDGYNPLAVIDAVRRKKALLEEGRGPVLLDVVTYRLAGHSPSDASSYRTKEEIEAWAAQDPLVEYKAALVAAKVADEEAFHAIQEQVADLLRRVLRLAVDEERSPRMNLAGNTGTIASSIFSNQRVEKMDDRPCDVLLPKEKNPRFKQIKAKIRTGLQDGQPVPKSKVLTMRDAIFEAILEKFYIDPTLIAYGEDVRDWGGAFAVYRGLTESLPYHRLFNSPISEAAIVASAVGYAVSGGRVIVELMYADFLGRAGDEVFNQLAKWQGMSAGTLRMPVVLRVSVGSKYGAQHSQDWSSMVAQIPGLKVVYPVTPYDAKGLMNSALAGTDPVVFFESQKLYDLGELFHPGGVPEDYYEVQIGEPEIKRPGKDLTLLAIGPAFYQAMQAAEMLARDYGLSAELIDARSLVPFNYDKVLESIGKTGRIVLVSEACERGSLIKEMAATLVELAFDDLDAPPIAVGARNWITPAYEFEQFFFPQPDWILDAINENLLPLPGYTPTGAVRREARRHASRLGV